MVAGEAEVERELCVSVGIRRSSGSRGCAQPVDVTSGHHLDFLRSGKHPGRDWWLVQLGSEHRKWDPKSAIGKAYFLLIWFVEEIHLKRLVMPCLICLLFGWREREGGGFSGRMCIHD